MRPAALPAPPGAPHFAALRIGLGLYLALYFALLIPHAAELYGPRGMVPEPALNPSGAYLPATPWIFGSDDAARAVVAVLCGLSVSLALGTARRAAAVVLWLGLVLLLHRNNLTLNISLPYLGWLLLATVVVPTGEGYAPTRRDPTWRFPRPLLHGAWLVFGVTYSYAGWTKLASPEWRSGAALALLADQPITTAVGAYLMSGLPASALRYATWASAGLELACLPLVLLAPTRALAWWGLTLMQVGILATLQLAELTLGVLLFHALVFDPAWLPGRIGAAGRWTHEPTPARAAQASSAPTSSEARGIPCRSR